MPILRLMCSIDSAFENATVQVTQHICHSFYGCSCVMRDHKLRITSFLAEQRSSDRKIEQTLYRCLKAKVGAYKRRACRNQWASSFSRGVSLGGSVRTVEWIGCGQYSVLVDAEAVYPCQGTVGTTTPFPSLPLPSCYPIHYYYCWFFKAS